MADTETKTQSTVGTAVSTSSEPDAYIHIPYKYRAPDPDADDRDAFRRTLLWDLATMALMLAATATIIWFMSEYRDGAGIDPTGVYNGILK